MRSHSHMSTGYIKQTRAMLARRKPAYIPDGECASLAANLHALAKLSERIAIAECNIPAACDAIEAARAWKGPEGVHAAWHKQARTEADMLHFINGKLRPFRLRLDNDGDPRGAVLRLYSTDPASPVETNSLDSEAWAIVSEGA